MRILRKPVSGARAVGGGSLSALVALVALGCGGSGAEARAPDASDDAYEDAPASSEEGEPTAASEEAAAEGESPPTEHPPDANGETRTVQVLADFVKERREKVRPCYDAVQKKQPELKGDLVIRFVLDPKGAVKKIEYEKEQSSIDSTEIADCVIAEMKTWQFPESSRGMQTEVAYPFNFNPRR